MGTLNKESEIMKNLFMIAVGFFAVVVAFLGLFFLNKGSLEMNVSDGDVVYFEYGSDREALAVEVFYKERLFNPEGTQVEFEIIGEVDYTTLGRYDVKVQAEYRREKIEAEITIVVEDNSAPVITLVKNQENYTHPKDHYVEEGYTAVDNHDGDVTAQVVREENEGTIIYTVTDSSGNTAKIERKIVYKDLIAPVITLKGEREITLNIGETYVEPGYEAIDECDGDISTRVEVEGTVDCSTFGGYTITYKVKDSSGNEGEATRNIKVEDLSAPSITLNGDTEVYVRIGENYVEKGYGAADNVDGDVSSKVVVDGSVNTQKTGSYKITYSVTDSSGNTSSVRRSIYVYEKQAENVVVNPGDKVIYLTFDDGPGAYTERLLNILDKYGVKVSFFVTNQFPDYVNLIGEAYDRGHTIAMHTYSHQYKEIYASPENYYKDLEKIAALCEQQTGEKPSILRFPGGTSNRVSAKYCTGIMTSIAKGVTYRGYLYCDWNVASGDASGDLSASAIANNVIEGVKGKSVSVVLQHDIQSESVDAVEEIICWGLANGYKFLPLDNTSPMVHHSIKN